MGFLAPPLRSHAASSRRHQVNSGHDHEVTTVQKCRLHFSIFDFGPE
jgi:hypothetical protein